MPYQKVKGVIVPLLTPFDDAGELAPDSLTGLVDYLIGRGVQGLFPLGTTGEGPLLSLHERQQVAEIVVSATRGRVPVIIHTGAINTRDTIALTRHARDAGADAAAVIPPFYFLYGEAAIEKHFAAVAQAVPDFPIYLYDNPPVVNGNHITSEMVHRLAQDYSNIVGLKDSSGALTKLFAARELHNGQFNTAIGPDGLILAGLAMGLDACVSGNANVVPELVVALYDAAAAGDLRRAQNLQTQLDAVRRILLDGRELSLYKAMVTRRGIPMGMARDPLPSVTSDRVSECWDALQALGLDLKA